MRIQRRQQCFEFKCLKFQKFQTRKDIKQYIYIYRYIYIYVYICIYKLCVCRYICVCMDIYAFVCHNWLLDGGR